MKTPGSYSSSSTNTPAPDLEVLSHDTPATPSVWNTSSLDDEDDDLLSFNVNQLLDEAGIVTKTASGNERPVEDWMIDGTPSRRHSSISKQDDQRRSSGAAVQHLLAQLDGIDMDFVFDDNSISAATLNEPLFDLSPAWKVVVETAFMPKYYRNDRKNIQCFPTCTLGSQRNGTDTAIGHGKSTTWCRGAVNARAFAIDPEVNIADPSMFEAFGAFVMNSDNPKTKPLASITDRIRGNMRKVDGRSFEIKIAPTVWKFEPPLSKKKSEENRNQCYFVVFMCFRGREVGRCVSPPFDLGSQKAEIRKKRALANEEAHWEPKHLVLDTFAQASNWAFHAMGLRTPNSELRKGPNTDVDVEQRGEGTLGPAGWGTEDDPTREAGSHPERAPLAKPHKQAMHDDTMPVVHRVPRKRISVALLLWLPPFGIFGAHHAYLGRRVYALTSAFTLNLLLVGWLLDALRLPSLVCSANFPVRPSDTSFMTMLEFVLLWLLFGLFGVHRYAAGDFRAGLFFTFTLGGLGMLWIRDGFHLGKLYRDGAKRSLTH